MSVNRSKMEAQLVLHEGLRLVPYPDTVEDVTCLVGYNVTARGWEFVEGVLGRRVVDCGAEAWFSRAEALQVLGADLDRLEKAVPVYFPFYAQLDEVRQRVVLDMAFNLQLHALGFKRCIAAIERRDWSTAVREMYNSKWAHQVGERVGQRCYRLAQMLLTGQEPTDIPALVAA